jgi:hypothetical protein
VHNPLSTTSWRCMGDWRYSSAILDLSIRWKWMINFTPLPLYPPGKSSRYPSDRRLFRLQSRSGRCGVGKIFLLLELEPWASCPQLYRLSYPGSTCWVKNWKLNFPKIIMDNKTSMAIFSKVYWTQQNLSTLGWMVKINARIKSQYIALPAYTCALRVGNAG